MNDNYTNNNIENEDSSNNRFSNKKILLPILFSFAIVLGIFIGNKLATNTQNKPIQSDYTSSGGKLDMLFNLIDLQYVDTIDKEQLTERVITETLSDLDPHSTYIPADELQLVNDDLESSFSGIGIQFNIQRDTIMVVAVIHGGPSEKLGIQPGDRNIEINDSSSVGKGISSDQVIKKLRGPKGTKVKVGIQRFGADEKLHYTIVRGDVPTKSVDVSYMIQKNVGYIKVSKFGSSTYEEFYDALTKLSDEGATSFIVDLRENSGGYLMAATAIVNEFLQLNNLIVYTEGKAQKREDIYANGYGSYKKTPLAVLIDEWSASASEIFAGAMQDNDRAIIIGRRSFGKGLVQKQFEMTDNSAIRLTIARYYTPSGRCIQKPYNDKDEYQKEVYKRYTNGELDSDTIKTINDSVKYYTTKGRVVYGGGGITPDIIIARDTIGVTPYYTKLHNTGTIYEYAFRYVDEHRNSLSSMDYAQLTTYLDKQPLAQLTMQYGTKKGITEDRNISFVTKELIQRRSKEYIVRNILGDEGFYELVNKSDNMVKAALEHLSK